MKDRAEIGPYTLHTPDTDLGQLFAGNGLNYERHVLVPEFQGLFLDVGSHIGYHVLRTSYLRHRVVPSVAVEPNPRNFEWLQRNLSIWPEWEAHLCAAHDRFETLSYVCADQWYGNGQTQPTGSGQFVYGVPLDAIVAGRRVGFIKLDIEGSELRALAGLQHTIETWRPNVMFECAEHLLRGHDATPEQLCDWFFTRGYRIHVLEKKPGWTGTYFHKEPLLAYLRAKKDTPWDLYAMAS